MARPSAILQYMTLLLSTVLPSCSKQLVRPSFLDVSLSDIPNMPEQPSKPFSFFSSSQRKCSSGYFTMRWGTPPSDGDRTCLKSADFGSECDYYKVDGTEYGDYNQGLWVACCLGKSMCSKLNRKNVEQYLQDWHSKWTEWTYPQIQEEMIGNAFERDRERVENSIQAAEQAAGMYGPGLTWRQVQGIPHKPMAQFMLNNGDMFGMLMMMKFLMGGFGGKNAGASQKAGAAALGMNMAGVISGTKTVNDPGGPGGKAAMSLERAHTTNLADISVDPHRGPTAEQVAPRAAFNLERDPTPQNLLKSLNAISRPAAPAFPEAPLPPSAASIPTSPTTPTTPGMALVAALQPKAPSEPGVGKNGELKGVSTGPEFEKYTAPTEYDKYHPGSPTEVAGSSTVASWIKPFMMYDNLPRVGLPLETKRAVGFDVPNKLDKWLGSTDSAVMPEAFRGLGGAPPGIMMGIAPGTPRDGSEMLTPELMRRMSSRLKSPDAGMDPQYPLSAVADHGSYLNWM